ncbi:MAG: hypothetical protein LBL39_03655 [Planctomycetaceae bacterium]|nr:hypothetical protein [Planctomycetaceae bacterium]
MKRLIEGEAYCLTGYGIILESFPSKQHYAQKTRYTVTSTTGAQYINFEFPLQ